MRCNWPNIGDRVMTTAHFPYRVVIGTVTDIVHMGDALETKGDIWYTITCGETGVRHPRLRAQIFECGHTSAAMLGAPQGAIYVWCNSRTDYPTMLARQLGRKDLVIKPASWLRPGVNIPSDRRIVLDHAFGALNPRAHDGVMYLKAMGVLCLKEAGVAC